MTTQATIPSGTPTYHPLSNRKVILLAELPEALKIRAVEVINNINAQATRTEKLNAELIYFVDCYVFMGEENKYMYHDPEEPIDDEFFDAQGNFCGTKIFYLYAGGSGNTGHRLEFLPDGSIEID